MKLLDRLLSYFIIKISAFRVVKLRGTIKLYILTCKMPFKSKRQLQTCFGRQLSAKAKGKKWTWNCKEFLRVTKKPCSLPTMKGKSSGTSSGCRSLKKGERLVSPFYAGARGGLYFYAGGVKVYVPKDAREYVMSNHKILSE